MNKSLILKIIYILFVLCCFQISNSYADTIQGDSSGVFINPTPSNAVVSGVGTNNFTWGTPAGGTPSSSLNFAGTTFSTDIKEVFSIGTLTYFNGTIYSGTGANSVDLQVTVTLTTPSGISQNFVQTLQLLNTVNTDNPQASADIVFLPTSFPDTVFTIGGNEYTLSFIGFGSIQGGGFSTIEKFHVLENQSASAELLGLINRACVVPEGESPVSERITDYPSCGPPGKLSPKWGSFGKKQVLEADSGEKLELECVTGTVNWYGLFYTSPEGVRNRVGICPFVEGCNYSWFFHSGDNDNNGKPDCIMRTRWISKDYGDNDKPNPWTNEPDTNENLLDWAESIFDVNSQKLNKLDYKFEYAVQPPIRNCPNSPKPEGQLVQVIIVDPLIGPETEAFFDEAVEILQTLPSNFPMGEDSSSPCDFDGDGDCDTTDLNYFESTVGTRRGEAGYNPAADIDGDGVIDSVDQGYLFTETSVPGDLDEDGDVDDNDYNEFLASYGSCNGDLNFNQRADFDGDNCITINDYRIMRSLN